jgi:hypothetical protein
MNIRINPVIDIGIHYRLNHAIMDARLQRWIHITISVVIFDRIHEILCRGHTPAIVSHRNASSYLSVIASIYYQISISI